MTEGRHQTAYSNKTITIKRKVKKIIWVRGFAHFVSKLTDSDGEQAETQHWIETSFRCNYISIEEKDELLCLCTEVGRMLGGMIFHPEKFCKEQK